MSDDHQDPFPVNPLPPVVVALALVIFGIEVLFLAGGQGIIGGPAAIGWRMEALQNYGFSARLMQYLVETGSLPLIYADRFVTYTFVQQSFTQTLWVCALLLAFGKVVGEVFKPWALLSIFVLSAAGGAAIFGLVPGNDGALFGGYPAVYGLLGAYTWLLWIMAGAMGRSQLSAFSLIGILMALQLLFRVLFNGGGYDWVADLGGFAVGFVLSFVVSPGGIARLLARLRKR